MEVNINRLPLSDKWLTCIDCGKEFCFEANEQRYFLSKQLSEPKRCPQCRRFRKLTLIKDNKGVRTDG